MKSSHWSMASDRLLRVLVFICLLLFFRSSWSRWSFAKRLTTKIVLHGLPALFNNACILFLRLSVVIDVWRPVYFLIVDLRRLEWCMLHHFVHSRNALIVFMQRPDLFGQQILLTIFHRQVLPHCFHIRTQTFVFISQLLVELHLHIHISPHRWNISLPEIKFASLSIVV